MYEINIGLAPWKYNKLQIFSFPPHQIRSNEERGSIQVRGNNTEQNKLRGNFAPSLYERKEKKIDPKDLWKLQKFKYSRIPNQDSSWLTKPKFKTIHSNDRSSSSWSDFDAAERISRGEEMADVSTNKEAQSGGCGPSIDACLCSSQLSPALAKAIEAAFVTIGESLSSPRNNKKIGVWRSLFRNSLS